MKKEDLCEEIQKRKMEREERERERVEAPLQLDREVLISFEISSASFFLFLLFESFFRICLVLFLFDPYCDFSSLLEKYYFDFLRRPLILFEVNEILSGDFIGTFHLWKLCRIPIFFLCDLFVPIEFFIKAKSIIGSK